MEDQTLLFQYLFASPAETVVPESKVGWLAWIGVIL
jgi:hypothetical protein